jgi:hypothetical protein
MGLMRWGIVTASVVGTLAWPTLAQAVAPDVGRIEAHTSRGRVTLEIPVTHHAGTAVGVLGRIDVRGVVRRPGGARVVVRHRAPMIGAQEGSERARHVVRVRLTRAQTARLTRRRSAAVAAAAALHITVTATQTFDSVSPPATTSQTVTPSAAPPGSFPWLASEYTDGTSLLLVDTDAQNRDVVTRVTTPVGGVATYWDHYIGQVGTPAVITYDPNITTDGLWFAGAGQWANLAQTVGVFPPDGTISGTFTLNGNSVAVSWPAVNDGGLGPMPAGSLELAAVRDA